MIFDTSSPESSPIELLRALESKVKLHVSSFAEQESSVDTWNGIGFRIGTYYFVAPMSEVTELLKVPPYTRLPNVKTWVLGASNIRGRLIPIIDLTVFFQMEDNVGFSRDRRVLVIDQNDQFNGLVVDSVEGMQHFIADSYQNSPPEVPDKLQPFVQGYYEKDKKTWSIFSIKALSDHSRFQSVAL